MKIYIVIPLYNEEKHIGNVVRDVSSFNIPIVIVDDGSTDSSIKIIKKSNVILLRHDINLGKGAAMKTGAEYAFSKGADAVIFMDSDGQHSASDIPEFVKALNTESFDLVLGSRNYNYAVPLVRFIGNKIASLVISILFHIYATDAICGFRGLTKKGYGKIKWNSTGYGVETEMLVRAGKTKLPFCEVPVETIYHDNVKGVTMLDAFSVMLDVIKWRLTI